MAGPRASEAEVRTVTGFDASVLTDVTGFIDTANMFVNEELVGQGLSDSRLHQIELYLAAHFATITYERGGLVKTATGTASETYSDHGDAGFQLTRFGQQAISLDSSGILAAKGSNKLKGLFEVV